MTAQSAAPADVEFRQCCCEAASDPGAVVPLPDRCLQCLRPWRVRGDGNCLWYALATAAAFNRGRGGDEVRLAERRGALVAAALQWRAAVSRELRDTRTGRLKEAYAPFWAAGEEGTESAQDETSYIEGIRKGEVFAGHLELHVAALVSEMCIAVLNLVESDNKNVGFLTVYRSPDTPPTARPLLVLRRGLHYDCLRVLRMPSLQAFDVVNSKSTR